MSATRVSPGWVSFGMPIFIRVGSLSGSEREWNAAGKFKNGTKIADDTQEQTKSHNSSLFLLSNPSNWYIPTALAEMSLWFDG